MAEKLNSFFVVPAKVFFEWGITMCSIPPSKTPEDEYVKFFNLLNDDCRTVDITIKIKSKKYPASISLVQQRDKKYGQRDIIRFSWPTKYETKKALRKMFIYSYVTTIKKGKPNLKELAEFIHLGGSEFRIKAIGKQKTEFDDMFLEMEDQNLFEYWKDSGKKDESIFLNNAAIPVWRNVDDIKKFSKRTHVIYLLHHSTNKQFYVGKADVFGNRVKKGQGRSGLAKDWDQFMFFELNPKFSFSLKQLEDFAIRLFSTILENNLGVKPIKNKSKLGNKAPLRKK